MTDFDWREHFQAVIRDRSGVLFRTAWGILGDTAAAEDACQQALCKGWGRRAEIRDPNALGAWLRRVVVNECLQVIRKRQRERRILRKPGVAATAGEGGAGADDRLAMRESLLAALEDLPEITRMVVVMRVVENRSGNEVAEIIDRSPSEVSRRLHHGLRCLREHLPQWERERRSNHGV
ncbi:MAG: sigma-70 family RNA polymerase sigma factor [Phycisphaeraceae bacterium]|nr:sigma-70 family RNA polymerase sigma factor [Phycisphaeraceae bacterium]